MKHTYRALGISVPVQEDSKVCLRTRLAKHLQIPAAEIAHVTIHKKSLDARNKRRIHFLYQLDFQFTQDQPASGPLSTQVKLVEKKSLDLYRQLGQRRPQSLPPVIIGSGPAGSLAALTLAEAGLAPIVIERGLPVEQRLRSVNRLRRSGEFDNESNYCFGEGGAGTFSDGKLTCGRNHPLIQHVFQVWVDHGAPKEILFQAHPHMGTDYLMPMSQSIRNRVEQLGGRYVFNNQVTDLKPGTKAKQQILLADGERLETDHLVLAIGHSARETYQMLLNRGLAMVAKPFAMGVRLEHPQEVIDGIQFGSCQLLPAAEYKLTAQVGSRGVWTFCMCPGGHLLPTGADAGHLAINGMSYHARNSGFANAAVVAGVQRSDYDRGHVLDGMRYQKKLEIAAFKAGGSSYQAPAQRLVDFISGRSSKGDLRSTYRPGITPARMDKLLPEFITETLRQAFRDYNRKMRGYICDDAMVVGLESKTSAPVTMVRGKDFVSTSHPGLYPCGEGAGYAGGIVSAALDGVRVATAIAESHPQA